MDTVTRIVALLGGTGKAAKRYGRTPSAVSNWKKDGKIPASLHYLVARDMEKMGWVYDPEANTLQQPRGRAA